MANSVFLQRVGGQEWPRTVALSKSSQWLRKERWACSSQQVFPWLSLGPPCWQSQRAASCTQAPWRVTEDISLISGPYVYDLRVGAYTCTHAHMHVHAHTQTIWPCKSSCEQSINPDHPDVLYIVKGMLPGIP